MIDLNERLVIVAPQYPEYSLLYADAMSEHRLVTLIVDGAQLDRELKDRDLHCRAEIRRQNYKSLTGLIQLVTYMRRTRPKYLHVQEPVGLRRTVYILTMVLVCRRSQLILTIHDPRPHGGRDKRIAARSRGLIYLLRRMAVLVVVHGNHCAAQFRGLSRAFSRKRVHISAHGTILVPGRSVAVRERSETLRVLFFGRMEEYKGLDLLASSIVAARSSGVNVELKVAGRGNELTRLRSVLNLLDGVEILDEYVPPLDLINLIQQCDCVALPYRDATQSGVLAAALSGGRFVIASRVGGISDVVEDELNGLLVNPNDVAALGNAICRTASDAELRERLENGARDTRDSLLSWSRIAASLDEGLRWL